MDWLDQLHQIRDEERRKAETVKKLADLPSQTLQQTKDVLAIADTHNLLRRVNKALLDGKGVIDFFDSSEKFDRAITLFWQGSVGEPRQPRHNDDSDYLYIMVASKNGALYVNNRKLVGYSPEDLKAALVEAARRPGRQVKKKK